MPREDIRSTYEAAQDTQQRLFTMRGQLEKLESDKNNLQRFANFLNSMLSTLEGRSPDEIGELEGAKGSVIEQIIEAQEEERRKISRPMHDGPAQALANFILQTEIATRLADSGQAEAGERLKRLQAHREVLVVRAVQQLLGNIRDCAQATQVKIQLDRGDHQVRAGVEDNGKGFDLETLTTGDGQGQGLEMLRKRIEQVGGVMEIDSPPDQGSRIVFWIPTGD